MTTKLMTPRDALVAGYCIAALTGIKKFEREDNPMLIKESLGEAKFHLARQMVSVFHGWTVKGKKENSPEYKDNLVRFIAALRIELL